MSELIIIDASKPIVVLQLKLASFIFPEPLTTKIIKDLHQELFDNWRLKLVDKDGPFPSQYIFDALGIEGTYERSYFTRAVLEYQRQINELFIAHGVFDDLAAGPYQTIGVFKNHLRFEPYTGASQVRLCNNTYRFSKANYDPSKAIYGSLPNTGSFANFAATRIDQSSPVDW